MTGEGGEGGASFANSSVMVLDYPAGAPADGALIAVPGLGYFVFVFPVRGPATVIEGVTDSRYYLGEYVARSVFLSCCGYYLGRDKNGRIRLGDSGLCLILVFFVLFT